MSDFDWTLAGPLLAIAALVAAWITPWILRDVRDAKQARHATPPEPTRSDPRTLCSVLTCPAEATTAILDRPLCAGHAVAIRTRGPYDQEAS